MDIEGLSLQPVGLFSNKAFTEGMLVFTVETVPEDGIVFALGYPAGIKEEFTFSVKLSVVVDDICFVVHVFSGILIDEVHQLLL